jgi:AcrR family transcriptional regulator
LHSVRRLFTERGYTDTTVRNIADRAGVNQSLIFRYFGSKHELFERSAPRHEFINA